MAFTDHCDVFASFHEDAFNRVLGHARRQRPSLFNYATAALAAEPGRLCQAIEAHPVVDWRANPRVTIVPLLPVPGTGYGLDFAVQLADLRLDFHPGDEFALPPDLGSLPAQRLALRVRVCGGLVCPPFDVVDRLVPPPDPPRAGNADATRPPRDQPQPPLQPLPGRELICFCLDAYVIAGMRIRTYSGKPWIEPFLQGFEIVDITPRGLEATLECYIQLVLRLAVLPRLRILLEMTPLDIIKDKLHLALAPMPTSPVLPNNPAIENDQLKAFIKVEVI